MRHKGIRTVAGEDLVKNELLMLGDDGKLYHYREGYPVYGAASKAAMRGEMVVVIIAGSTVLDDTPQEDGEYPFFWEARND